MAWKVFWFLPAASLSLWSWTLLVYNPYLALLASLSTLLLYLSLFKPGRIITALVLVSVLTLTVVQIRLTPKDYLFNFTPAEKSLARLRTGEYPSSTSFLTRRWEERRESIIVSKTVRNFSEIIDPNLYFFSGHPRERAGEPEKFTFLLIPLFVYGAVLAFKSPGKNNLLLALIPLAATSIVGPNNLGPFSLYPFFLSVISFSFYALGEKIKLLTGKRHAI